MRKQKLILILMLFVSANVFAQSGWVDVSPANVSAVLNRLYIFSSNSYLVKANSDYSLTSTNQGATWIKVPLNFLPSDHPDYEFASLTEIYSRKTGPSTSDPSWLLKSTNSGNSFDTIYTINFPYRLSYVNFINPQTGFIKISYMTPNGNFTTEPFLRTTNSGLTWDTSYKFWTWASVIQSQTRQINFASYEIRNSHFGFATLVERGHAAIIGDYYNSSLRKTSNGGATWDSASPVINNVRYDKIAYSDSSWAYFKANNKLLRYRGNGLVIDTISQMPGNYYFKNRKEGFYFTGSVLMYTGDSSRTWLTIPFTHDINNIQFLDSSLGFILTNDGKIFRTTDGGGISGINLISPNLPEKYSLSQNYPNPFNPSTKINYEIKSSGFVSLKVFDMLGKEAGSLVNEKQSAGSYAVDFNSTEFNLPSGIYFYTLNAGEFKETRKMILIK